MLTLVPITFAQACAFIDSLHRHHRRPQGWKFGIGAHDGEKMVGVVMVGRPISRMLDDGFTAEVTRLCTDGSENACSLLYSAARRAAKAMGYRKIVTYILDTEPGTSLKAAGWTCHGDAGGGSWSRDSRLREDNHPLQKKVRWEATC